MQRLSLPIGLLEILDIDELTLLDDFVPLKARSKYIHPGDPRRVTSGQPSGDIFETFEARFIYTVDIFNSQS